MSTGVSIEDGNDSEEKVWLDVAAAQAAYPEIFSCESGAMLLSFITEMDILVGDMRFDADTQGWQASILNDKHAVSGRYTQPPPDF